MRRLLALAVVLLALLSTSAARADRHIRVILDTSKSMSGTKTDPPNDRGRLATLSTLLLYDLAEPAEKPDESFKVIPFRKDWRGKSDWGAPLPVIVPKGRAAFAQELYSLPYDGQMTYFYPGLREAMKDLERSPRGPSTVRLIVLITDGLPEDATSEEESRLIATNIVPELQKEGIRLYVLAVGRVASDNRSFFEGMVRAGAPDALGEVLTDPSGQALLGHMITIFSHNFGYAEDGPQELSTAWPVSVAGDPEREETALVLFNLGKSPPAFESSRFKSPPGFDPTYRTFPDGNELLQGSEVGASYSLRWLLYRASPPPGSSYSIAAQPGVKAAVLRPARVEINLQPAPGRKRVDQAMAEAEFPALAEVKNAGGAGGLPPPLGLSYTPNGVWQPKPDKKSCQFSWCLNSIGAPPDPPRLDARTYRVLTRFEPVPEGQPYYEGNIEILAKRGDVLIGDRLRERAHKVIVFPFVHVKAMLREGDAVVDGETVRALERRERGCAKFKFELDPRSRLPHPDSPRYPLRAVVRGVTLDGPLKEAQATLDGLPLTFENSPPAVPTEWDKGRSLSRDDLLREHSACVRIGRPEGLRATADLTIPVSFILLESPYDDFDVVEAFTLKVRVTPPSLIEKWGPWLVLILGPLALLAALWYLRRRPELPPDLGVAVAAAESGTPQAARPLAEGSILRRLLGLRAEHPILTERGDAILGWIVAVDDELYHFRPERGVQLFGATPASILEFRPNEGHATLHVHHDYRAVSPHGSFVFRVEYR